MHREVSSVSPGIRPGSWEGFNLSRWAIRHGGFTAFLLVLLLVAGAISFMRIGQKEDADFTFRVMVVQVHWPGAPVAEMQEQVVDKIERKRIEQDLPIGVNLGRISDQAQVVTKSIHEFLEAFGEAVGIVLIVALIALGWRAGLVVALTIPMVLAATAFVMSLMGIDLHRISLGALIIALGLLVDDAMIAVEMMDRKLEEGFDRLSAATFAYTSTAFPMLTGTLITVAGFIPVGFAQSTAGEYVSSLFWVTGIALIISWFAAVYFTPWIGYRLLKVRSRKASSEDHNVYDRSTYRAIRAVVAWCVHHRKTVVLLSFAALVASVA